MKDIKTNHWGGVHTDLATNDFFSVVVVYGRFTVIKMWALIHFTSKHRKVVFSVEIYRSVQNTFWDNSVPRLKMPVLRIEMC